MRFLTVLAAGAYLSEHVTASPIVEITNRMVERSLESRAVFTYQGCYSEGTSGGGIGAGKALVGKTVTAPSGGLTVEYCAQSCAGFVLFGLETTTTCDTSCVGNTAQICGAYQKLSICSPGPQGIQGPTGPAGAAGAKGAPGAKGPGAQGVAGAAGSTGATGVKTALMDNLAKLEHRGAPGNPGLGAAGDTGAPGADGAQGPIGATGDTGAPGPAGPCRPAGRNMGFESIANPSYDQPWDISPGFINNVAYSFNSRLEPNAGLQHALLDFTLDGARSGRFEQGDVQLCPGTTYTFTASLKWTATGSSTTPPICTIYFYLGPDENNLSELVTLPTRIDVDTIEKAALPTSYTEYTGTYIAGAGDESDELVVLIDCDGNAENLGLISFDSFRLAPTVV
ncbi:putative Collagen alpha-1(IX) chain [Glarea lozoyensis 74030]|uniref:Putative Collagen alpha-1(IX) chain n=1 Tax=Glarea lozoyensis (strain ATCC 74030 / MF5533) TaxID=1104152 RepID=H0EFU6_GLAL7|nr:putative Collagen alpha-1(IX) chain [Glarea lozoyensis 74030]